MSGSPLASFGLYAAVAAGDIGRARAWYRDKLGLEPDREDEAGLWYRFGGETWLYVYATESAGTAKNTVAGWQVTNIEAVMAELRARGVRFEDYDLGEQSFGKLRTVDGLADFGIAKAAWFKDSEGNTFEISEVLEH